MNNEESKKINRDTKIDIEVRNNIDEFINDNPDLLDRVEAIMKKFDKQEFCFEHRKYINLYSSNVFTLILTANEIERRTLFYYFEQKETDIIQIPCDGIIYSFFAINGIKVAHVEPESIGSYTDNGMATTLKKALNRIKPTVVITLGVAFGVNYVEHKIGDVIVGRQLFAYDKATKIKKKSLNVKKLHVLESDGSLLYKLKSRIQMEKKTVGNFDNEFQVILGNMLTGEYVVDSSTFRKMIVSPFEPFGVVGGEMEGYGFFNILKDYKHAHGILIKGICDWGAGKNKSDDLEKKTEKNSKDYKNIFQVLAMLNVCIVCDQYLVHKNFFSDYKLRGHIKRYWRFVKRIKSIILRKGR